MANSAQGTVMGGARVRGGTQLGAAEHAEATETTHTGVDTTQLQRELWGLTLIVVTLILLLSVLSYSRLDLSPTSGTATANWIGPVGAAFAHVLLGALGLVAFPLILTLGFAGLRLMRRLTIHLTGGIVAAYLGALLSATVITHLLGGAARPFGHPAGGVVGLYTGEVSRALLSTTGTALVFFALLLASAALLSGRTLAELAATGIGAGRALLRFGASALPWRERSSAESERDGLSNPDDSSPGRSASPKSGGPRIVGIDNDSRDGAPDDDKASGKAPEESERAARKRARKEARRQRQEAKAAGEREPGEDAESSAERKARAGDSASTKETTQAPTNASGPRIVESEAMSRPAQLELIEEGRKAVAETVQRDYQLPDLALLDYHPPVRQDIDADDLRENALRLEEKLADFNVKGEVVEIHPGPVVTTYEFKPAPGIKISRIQNLSDDLTMALAAQRVRIIAPIPGKAVVGIEVPNRSREIVYLREVFNSKGFRHAKHKLTIALGKDIVGEPTVTNLAKAPHLLVAGATGSGKSVAINAFILSLLFRANPDEVKLIMVDPKMLELTIYQGIPHLLLPVVTDPKEAALALKWAVGEMERRYRLMSRLGVRSIINFNQRVKAILAGEHDPNDPNADLPTFEPEDDDDPLEPFPYLVVIVDELADLMMVASKDVETSIARLAQMARAAGIHLILATQRPSVDVITGLIKANFPTRLSFQVASKTDSRTILDRGGAETLLGMGDMLFLPPGTSRLERNHGAFVSDEEVRRVVAFVREQRRPQYDMDILKPPEDGGSDSGEDEPYDEFYDQALAIVAETRQASISYLQRRLKIGYNRAARIIEHMEREGVVGPSDGSRPREVYVDPM